jgi:hypothetical protein
MRVQKRNPWLYSLGVVLAAMVLWGSQAGADVTSDRPGSVVIWPKVISDGTRDTLITLTNTRNEEAFVHCTYINAIGFCRLSGDYCSFPSTFVGGSEPACPGGPGDVCDLTWSAVPDFDILLTRQQPTIWRVSTGRIENPLIPADGSCDNMGATQSCPGLFMAFAQGAPGQVPPMGETFRGELRCVQTSRDGSALAANGLKGEAIIETIAEDGDPPTPIQSTQISKYNSINIRAAQPPFADPSILPLNGVIPVNGPPLGDYNVYNACPEAVEFTNYSVGASDLAAPLIEPAACAGSGCPVNTEITIIPCRVDFENDIATRFVVDIRYTNEFEQELSVGPLLLNCWVNFGLENLGFTNMGWTIQRTRINPSGSGLCIGGDADLINTPCAEDEDCVDTLPDTSGVCAPASGVLAIVEEFHETDLSLSSIVPAGTDAANPYSVDSNGDGFIGKLGRCRGDLDQTCDQDSDCGPGKCRNSGLACEVGIPGSCGVGGDFCDQCMNDEIRFQPDVIVAPLP